MTIEILGNGFIEVLDEDGMRNLVRLNSIQRICDVDEIRDESYLTVAGRTILVRAPLDELRQIVAEDQNGYRRR